MCARRVVLLMALGILLPADPLQQIGSYRRCPTLTRLCGVQLGFGRCCRSTCYRQKELSGLFRVGSDGRFTYPMVGSVEAGGRLHQLSL